MDSRAAVLCVLVYDVGNPPVFLRFSRSRTHFGSVLKKQNTKGRLRPILSQADI